MTKQLTPIESAAAEAEEALGNNLVALADLLDFRVRQGDKRTLAALADLQKAHTTLCKAGAHRLRT